MKILEKVYQYEILDERKILQSVAKRVDPSYELKDIILEMISFMHQAKGIGLSAPQVGISQRFFVIELPRSLPLIFVNPEIVFTSLEVSTREEGCLSLPNIYAHIQRPSFVKVQAYDALKTPFTLEAKGLLATVIQHELDHLNGIFFIDHLSKAKRTKLLKHYMNSYKKL